MFWDRFTRLHWVLASTLSQTQRKSCVISRLPRVCLCWKLGQTADSTSLHYLPCSPNWPNKNSQQEWLACLPRSHQCFVSLLNSDFNNVMFMDHGLPCSVEGQLLLNTWGNGYALSFLGGIWPRRAEILLLPPKDYSDLFPFPVQIPLWKPPVRLIEHWQTKGPSAVCCLPFLPCCIRPISSILPKPNG